jgi:hypothetical protein
MVQEGWALIRGCWRYLKPGVKNRTHVDCTIAAPGASLKALMVPLIAAPLLLVPVPDTGFIPDTGYAASYGPTYFGPYRGYDDYWGLGAGFGGSYVSKKTPQSSGSVYGTDSIRDRDVSDSPVLPTRTEVAVPIPNVIDNKSPIITVIAVTTPVVPGDTVTAVPEPASILLFGIGLLGLFFVMPKKNV